MTEPGAEPSRPDPPAGGTQGEPPDLLEARYAKVDGLRAQGVDPYPSRFDRTHTLGEIRDEWGHLGAEEETDVHVRTAGRVMLVRGHGKLVFATMRDSTGEVQLLVSQAVCGKETMDRFKAVDAGDWVGVEGRVISTRRGELSVEVADFCMLAKALRPMPDKQKGLADVETRYRQRYVDLMVNEDARRVFTIRHAAIDAMRAHLGDRGFVEVETPVLGTIQGGATARPFVTHYNALDIDVYLRIALELHLKRLVVGGMDRVFEIGRVFRNEGLDSRHNPEFTILEAYEAFTDYAGMMDLTEGLLCGAAQAALGTTVIDVRGRAVDLAPPY
ncbi:MAG: lysine--tRNA ligase, partial [Acidimicrobiia bacterium]|nr:lysine--tRNA ligase [Acidimicrobiia bacterium]